MVYDNRLGTHSNVLVFTVPLRDTGPPLLLLSYVSGPESLMSQVVQSVRLIYDYGK